MHRKRHSGLANHRRAYGCDGSCPLVCPVITLANIATPNENRTIWILNKDIIIIKCQTLEIPEGQSLLTNHFTLTNNGNINVRGSIRNAQDDNSVTINNGVINVFNTGDISIVVSIVNFDRIFINNGIINNYGYIYCRTSGVINNNTGAKIFNYGKIINGLDTNNNGKINNIGSIINDNADGTGEGYLFGITETSNDCP